MIFFRAGLLLAMATLFTLSAHAQESVSPDTSQIRFVGLSATVLLGGGPGSFHGPGLIAGLEVETQYGLLVGRAMRAYETLPLFPSEEPVERNSEIGVLYGRRLDISSVISVSGAVGVSSVSIIRRGRFMSEGSQFHGRQYEELKAKGVGVPIDLRIRLRDSRGWGGIQLSLVGNVNNIESYSGLMIGLYFGK